MNTLQPYIAKLRDLHNDENGQTFVEYFLVVSLVVVGLAGSFKLFNQVLFEYYNRISKWMTLPIP